MISTHTAIPGLYDYGEVARSVFIAIAAFYAALELTGRITTARGRVRLACLSGGAVAMGIGIWEMHLTEMPAFRLPVPVAYHWPASLAALLVTLSILPAILFSLIALLMAFGLREETKWTVSGGVLLRNTEFTVLTGGTAEIVLIIWDVKFVAFMARSLGGRSAQELLMYPSCPPKLELDPQRLARLPEPRQTAASRSRLRCASYPPIPEILRTDGGQGVER